MLFAALILDAIFGEPRALWDRVPHPVVLIGRFIGWMDNRYNHGQRRYIRGMLALSALIWAVLIPTLIVHYLPFGWVLEIIGGAILLAHRSLTEHVGAVATALRSSLDEGRESVAMIVGRDPNSLDQAGVSRAAIESAAENFSDGVVAPAFWFLVAGLPGIAVYKAVNTADSMIGYRTERHRKFGWASARLDDVLNWVPARLTALLVLAVGGAQDRFKAVMREAPDHKSINAGWPEAAMAHVLNVALAGPRSYPGGVQVDDPFVNQVGGARDLGPGDIDRSVGLLWRAWIGLIVIAIVAGGIALL